MSWKFEPSGAVRRGSSIQVPDGQPVHDRISAVCRVPSVSTAKLGTPRLNIATVRAFEGFSFRRRLLGNDDLGVGKVVGDRRDRCIQPFLVGAVDHQHRQRARMSQVGVRHPDRRQWCHRRHPHPGPARLGQLPVQLGGIHRVGLGQ